MSCVNGPRATKARMSGSRSIAGALLAAFTGFVAGIELIIVVLVFEGTFSVVLPTFIDGFVLLAVPVVLMLGAAGLSSRFALRVWIISAVVASAIFASSVAIDRLLET